jgi:hypothetical protein
VDQPKEDVLGTDEAVVEEARLFLCEHKNSASPVCESFEHSTASIRGQLLIRSLQVRVLPAPAQQPFSSLFSVIGNVAYRL